MTDTLGFVCLGQVTVFGHGVKLFHVSQYFLSSDLMTCKMYRGSKDSDQEQGLDIL